MSAKKIIALSGDIQIGKSTLISKLLAHTDRPISGFMTKLQRDNPIEGKGWPLYIYPANVPEEERTQSEANLIGFPMQHDFDSCARTFNSYGAALLTDIPAGHLIVMDEIGVLESKAEIFKEAILNCLRSDNPVILTIKAKPVYPFVEQVKALAGEENYYWVTEENRDRLAEELASVVEKW